MAEGNKVTSECHAISCVGLNLSSEMYVFALDRLIGLSLLVADMQMDGGWVASCTGACFPLF